MKWQLRHKHLGDLLLFLIRRRQRFRITGTSMLPLLKPGEEVLVAPVQWRRNQQDGIAPTGQSSGITLDTGDLVVACHPFRPNLRLIKRVIAVRDDQTYLLMGDNPEAGASTDSRSFGAVPPSHILGKVICRFP
ncbi:MAG: nickel-type superoxide dismutase maturation protease [Cyanobacteria bacterium P01_A01_bin.123]